jgi:DNA-binding CsgD family transcriptional regulator
MTRAEADFAMALMSGCSLADIANRGARSIHTVRTHLGKVMAKTQTRRQSELVRLLMGMEHAKSGVAVDATASRSRRLRPITRGTL